MFFKQIFEEKLSQYAYLIGCQQSGEAIIVDPMRDIDRYQVLAAAEDLKIIAAADTHIHADYLTGLREYAEEGIRIYASDEGGDDWSYRWLIDSNYNYQLLNDGDRFSIGNIQFKAIHTPGHTPEHLSYEITDRAAADRPMGILTGDFIFVGDIGRPDLLETAAGIKGTMKSSAKTLYKSIQKFKNFPEYLQIWPGHGAGSACGKALSAVPDSTVGYELRFNPAIQASDNQEHFVDYILEGQPEPPVYFSRMKRDNRQGPPLLKDLPQPPLMKPSQVIELLQNNTQTLLLDTRDRSVFMKSHASGSLLVPFDRDFVTTAGSYVREEGEIVLVIDSENLQEAVRGLVRIGLDKIRGFVPIDTFEDYIRSCNTESTATVTFDQVPEQSNGSGILDVRRATEYHEGHIEGAVNISHSQLIDRMSELSKNRPWLVHCKSGRRAAIASAFLEREGYDVTYIDDHIMNMPRVVREQ